ncbi:MAG: hypothetical protein AAFR54_12940 [Planctomycetota bacterium]
MAAQVTLTRLVPSALLACAGLGPALAHSAGPAVEATRAPAEAVAAPLVLGDLPELAGTALASFTLHAPEERAGGAWFGAVDLLGGRAEAVLHPVQPGIDGANEGWLLSVDAASPKLSDLVPILRGTVVDKIHLRRTAVVLSTADVRVDAATMTDDVRGFYGTYFRSARPMLEVARGVNLLTRFEPDDGSPLGAALGMLGIETDGVLLQGTVLKGASFSDLKKAYEDDRLAARIRESMELRAYLPAVDLGGLPDSYVAGETSLIVNARPGIGLAFRLVADGGTPETSQAFECRVDVAQGDGPVDGVPAPTEVQVMGTALGTWEDAFGIRGFDLEDPRLLLEVDTAQRVGFGVRAGFAVGERDMAVAAKLQLHAVTGVPVGGFFEGTLEGVGASDLVALANGIGAARGMKPIPKSALPEFELRDLYLKFAPTGGDADLGTSDGFALRGELHAFGTQLAHVDGSLNLGGIVPDIALEGRCADVDLGALALEDALVDVRLGLALDQHFRLRGRTKLLSMTKDVDVDCSLKKLRIDVSEELGGVYSASYHLSSPSSGRPTWRVAAAFENQLSKTLADDVSGKVRAWAEKVERDAQKTQRDLDRAKAEVRKIDGDIERALREVRARRDRQGAGLRRAQAEVQKIRGEMDQVRAKILAKRKERKRKVDAKRRARDSAKSAWKKAKAATKRAKLHKKPKLKAAEAAKFADYQAKNAAYGTANAGYQALLRVPIEADARMVALATAMGTATGALKAAEKLTETWPEETDPKVAALYTARGTALAALNVAKGGVFVGGGVLAGAGKATAWAAEHNGELLMVDAVRFDAQLAGYLAGNAVEVVVDGRLLGKRKTLRVRVAPASLAGGGLTRAVVEAVKEELERA